MPLTRTVAQDMRSLYGSGIHANISHYIWEKIQPVMDIFDFLDAGAYVVPISNFRSLENSTVH